MSPTPPPEHNTISNSAVTAAKQDFSSVLGLTQEDQLPTSAKALEAMVQLKIEKERVAFETMRNSNLKLALEFLNCSLKAQIPPHLIPSMFPSYETKLTKRISSQEPLVVANMTFPKVKHNELFLLDAKQQGEASAELQTGVPRPKTDNEIARTNVDKTISSATSIKTETPAKATASNKSDSKQKRKEAQLKVRHWQKTTPKKYSSSVEKPPRSPLNKHKSSTKRPASFSCLDISKTDSARVCSTDSVSSTISMNEGTPATETSFFKPDNYKARAFDKPMGIPPYLVNHPHSYPPTHLPTYPMKFTDSTNHTLPPYYMHNPSNIPGPPHPDMMYREFVTLPPHYPYPYAVPQVLKPTNSQPSSLKLRHVSVHSASTAANPAS